MLAASALNQLRKPSFMKEKNYNRQCGGNSTRTRTQSERGNSEILSNKSQFVEAEGGRGMEEEKTKVAWSSQSSAID